MTSLTVIELLAGVGVGALTYIIVYGVVLTIRMGRAVLSASRRVLVDPDWGVVAYVAEDVLDAAESLRGGWFLPEGYVGKPPPDDFVTSSVPELGQALVLLQQASGLLAQAITSPEGVAGRAARYPDAEVIPAAPYDDTPRH